ncbi:type II toxin-antitoxin system RelE family toxin [Nocardia sp. NPDC004260]
MARVVLTDEAKEDLRDLDRSDQKRVLRKLKELETHPSSGANPLVADRVGT